ncbi:hypothetical protein [Mucilaginibacter aquaedulcis]|uniref:hypothetical protein n=1 Tax=Mucilaginibacter aquaedulcis TaxID=1187081 RepID=UPI0025B56E84|nr:hypothetical protein [Mucilaginibacter aquaedulcis]MDN3549092.1 hypothetical protein [Mucilaginibacter aquaedulcis]
MMPVKISKVFFVNALLALFLSCGKQHQVFESNCNEGVTFKKVDFAELTSHLEKYDKQYVEVTGKYIEGYEQSALFNDSLFADHSLKKALWVNFSQDCPLYLTGTRIGLFEYNNGTFTQINKSFITIKGKVNVRNTGYLNKYRGTLDKVSFIKL